jgi:hypothetical protein
MEAYPDSVSLVRPPNTTMPNTLAALPSSQYATLFELVLGKLLELERLLADASDVMDASEPMMALLLRAWVDFHLTDVRIEGDVRGGAGRKYELGHGRHTKRRRASRGAAVRSWGKAWKTDTIAMALGAVVVGDGRCGATVRWWVLMG